MKGCYYKKGSERKAVLVDSDSCPIINDWELIREEETTNKLICSEHSE